MVNKKGSLGFLIFLLLVAILLVLYATIPQVSETLNGWVISLKTMVGSIGEKAGEI